MRDVAEGRAGRVARDAIGRRGRAGDSSVRCRHRRDGRSVVLSVGAPAPDPTSRGRSPEFPEQPRERWLDAREKLADNVSRSERVPANAPPRARLSPPTRTRLLTPPAPTLLSLPAALSPPRLPPAPPPSSSSPPPRPSRTASPSRTAPTPPPASTSSPSTIPAPSSRSSSTPPRTSPPRLPASPPTSRSA